MAPSVFERKGFGRSVLRAFSDIFIVFVIAVAVRAVVSHLLSLKAVVRNKFLTTANSHQLHSLLLTL